ncbi:hypothetical protein VTO42DRAFT_3878 [Malbranchea cinnamomea]
MSDSQQTSEASLSLKPKPFSISLSTGAKKPSASPLSASQGSISRPGVFDSSKPSRSKFHHDESDDEVEQPPVHEEVTAFDHAAGGAISANKGRDSEKGPLVIKVNSKNNWRERIAQARKSWLPPEVQAQRAAQEAGANTDAEVEVEQPSKKYGLSYAQPLTEKAEDPAVDTAGDTQMTDVDTTQPAKEPLSQDDQALRALIQESKGEGSEGRKSTLVIETQRRMNGLSPEEKETRSFRADVASRPDPATLEDYAAVPVEEFGAALLRGMGWKEGEPVNRSRYGDTVSSQTALKARIPERRPGYLGIGAKDISGKAGAAELELGAWGKSAMKKAKKPGEGLYTPVLMRSKKTGELITEEEFKARQREGQEKTDSWKERRDRNLEKYGRDRRRREDEHRDDSEGYWRSRESSHRNGSLSPDRERRWRKQYDDRDSDRRSDDDRHYRDRDRDRRDRDQDRDRESRRDRDRGRGRDRGDESDKDRRYRTHRRSPDGNSSSNRSSRRYDSDRDRGRRDRHRDDSRDRR